MDPTKIGKIVYLDTDMNLPIDYQFINRKWDKFTTKQKEKMIQEYFDNLDSLVSIKDSFVNRTNNVERELENPHVSKPNDQEGQEGQLDQYATINDKITTITTIRANQ